MYVGMFMYLCYISNHVNVFWVNIVSLFSYILPDRGWKQVAAGLFQVYCVVVVGTVTRVLDSQVSQGVDQTKFYGIIF